MNSSKELEKSTRDLLPVLVQGRVHMKFNYRAIWNELTSEQKEQVTEFVDEARHFKIYNHLFRAFDAKDIEAAYREQETVKQHASALKEDGYLTSEQADRISVLIEFALLDWLKEIDDYSTKFLAEIRAAITKTESDNEFDSTWTFDEIEFYLQLGFVSQEALNEGLSLVIQAGNHAYQNNRKDLVEEFQILAKTLTDWDSSLSQPLSQQAESWFAKQRRLFLERKRSLLETKFQPFVKDSILELNHFGGVLPSEIGNLTNLTHLTKIFLNHCPHLINLPESIGNLTNLTTLNFNRCFSLSSLPESLGNLTNLNELEIDGSPLTRLPESIGNLTNLITLRLYGNSRTNLPENTGSSVFSFPRSQGNPTLISLPESIGNLISLTTLCLDHCSKLTSLPESIGNLTNLTELNLNRGYSFTHLPESIGNLTNLTELRIFGSPLTHLPESIGNLTNLTKLCFDHCPNLTSLPESIGNLTNLTELNLNSCYSLTFLPKSIGNLTNLRTLNLDGCKSLKRIGNLTDRTLFSYHVQGKILRQLLQKIRNNKE